MNELPSVKGRLTFEHEGVEHTTEVTIHGLLQTQLTELPILRTKLANLLAAAERAEQQLRVCGECPVQSQIVGVADDVLAAIKASEISEEDAERWAVSNLE